MKRTLLAALLVARLAGAAPTQITLLHVNDTHSHLAPFGPKNLQLSGTVGGLTKAASIIAAERAADPSALFVHGGDLMHGDFFFTEYLGVPELQLLQALGLDAMVLGTTSSTSGRTSSRPCSTPPGPREGTSPSSPPTST